jgi:hypothetical protein
MNESSGLKAHRTLAPANARYARRQMMWGGKVRRDRFCTAKETAIAAMAGQKILFSGRGMALWSVSVPGETIKMNKGETIKAKTHAEIETIAYLSIMGVEGLGWPDSKECIGALDILVLYWRPRCMPLALNTLGQNRILAKLI